MKKKLFVFATSALACGMLLASCGGTPEASNSISGDNSISQPAAEEKIELTAEKSTIYVGETVKVNSSVAGVTFSSRDENIATVDENGVVTALMAGTATITARKSGYKTGSVSITIEKAPMKETQGILEFEDAEHYDPDDFWGFVWGDYVMGPGDTPVEEVAAASGGKSVGWFNEGCKETIKFTSSKAGKVDMGFMMAYNADTALGGLITIKVNGVELPVNGKVVSGPSDGDANNYYDWNEVMFTGVSVSQGENTIIVECVGQTGVNMDCVRLYGEGFTFEQIKFVPAPPADTEIVGKVDYYVGGYEFGPNMNGVLLKLDGDIAASALSTDLFSVKTNGKERVVEDVYLVDAAGARTNAASGRNVRFDLQVRYESSGWMANDYGGNPFTYNNVNTWKNNITVEVKQKANTSVQIGSKTYGEKLAIANQIENRIIPDVADWGAERTCTDGTRTLRYKAYETDALRNDGVSNPLIIWLHGQGEGGTDVDIALLGNDVTNLGQSKVQSHFISGAQKGAYVLAVQSPTMWMDNGSGQNHGGAAHSIYTSLLKKTIDQFITENNDIDSSKIIIGGCSNGGYMTMEMAITYPSFFAAYYPTCEAYQDAFVTDENIATLKDLSIWFTHAANDQTVNPANFTVATYKRLIAAGAQDVHFSYFTDVRGKEGRIDDGENDYQGHYSWIYVLKDECLKDVADPANPAAPSTSDVLVNNQPVSLWGWAASK